MFLITLQWDVESDPVIFIGGVEFEIFINISALQWGETVAVFLCGVGSQLVDGESSGRQQAPPTLQHETQMSDIQAENYVQFVRLWARRVQVCGEEGEEQEDQSCADGVEGLPGDSRHT